jgi:predicted ester cyclase
MSAADVRETMEAYVEVLLARGAYGRFFSDDIAFEIVGTDQRASGAEATEQAIRFMHEVAFDAVPEVANVLVDDHGAAAEAMFVGTHVGEFAGVPASGSEVRVPYSVFYDVDAGRITSLRTTCPWINLSRRSTPSHESRPLKPELDTSDEPGLPAGLSRMSLATAPLGSHAAWHRLHSPRKAIPSTKSSGRHCLRGRQ